MIMINLTGAEWERFHNRIVPGHGCWEWRGECHTFGYGQFSTYRDGGRQRYLAHRLSFRLATGIDPASKVVRHTCDNPPCCDPAHLVLGTQADNVQDAVQRGRVDLSGLNAYRLARDGAAYARRSATEKSCSRCRTTKPRAAFGRNASTIDGQQYWCKDCYREYRGLSERERRALRRKAAA